MKKLFVFVTLLVCGAAIIYGNLHWNKKISAQGDNVTSTKETESVQGEVEEEVTGISNYSSNLPKNLQEKINKAANGGEPLKLVIYGSNVSNEEDAWSTILSEKLKAAYGENVFEITIRSTDEKTTHALVNEKSYKELNEMKPDILLFEPPMLKDNGVVGIVNTLENIQTMVDDWQDVNKEMTLMIQPPNPLFSATYYPSEISQLKEYADKNNIVYLNHWENWPDLDDAKMKDYLNGSNEANKSGNKVWADYLISYFIAE